MDGYWYAYTIYNGSVTDLLYSDKLFPTPPEGWRIINRFGAPWRRRFWRLERYTNGDWY